MSKTSWWRNRKWDGSWSAKSTCSADRHCRNHRDRTLWSRSFPFLTGPLLFLVYMLTGAFMYLMMRAIGEMLYMDRSTHLINFITKYIGKGWGYFSGWSYWSPWYFWEWQRSPLFQLCPAFWFQIGQPGRFKLSFSALKLCKLCEGFGRLNSGLEWSRLSLWWRRMETPAGHASLTNITSGFQMFPMIISLSWPSKWSSCLSSDRVCRITTWNS